MTKFLYITDQEEYSDHSFIGPLFEKYLNKHFDISIVYFSKFSHDFEIKNNNKLIIPEKYRKNPIDELEKNGINFDDYQFVAVRNDTEILKEVLKKKVTHNFKVAFRLSFPKRIAKIQTDEANKKFNFFDIVNNKIKTYTETSLINECDIFLPTSIQMKNDYFKDVKTRTYVIPSAIDPEILHENIQHEFEEKRFFYAGTLDKLREFETVLDAFNEIETTKFKIMISSKDPEYTKNLIESFPNLIERVDIYNATTKKELLELIAKADIGLSMLPNIELFNSSTPMKVLDYYSSAVPCIMTRNENNMSIFDDNHSAWLCGFSKNEIKEKLEYIISLNKEDVAKVGENGQKRLLDVRNYERIAADFAHQLNIL